MQSDLKYIDKNTANCNMMQQRYAAVMYLTCAMCFPLEPSYRNLEVPLYNKMLLDPIVT